jgi:hypothetical protein
LFKSVCKHPPELAFQRLAKGFHVGYTSKIAKMVTLIEFPTEILSLILGALADIDLQSLFTARRVCKIFQIVVTDILDNTIANHGVAVHDLIMSQFSTVLDSRVAGAPYQPSAMLPCAPYAALPWFSSPEGRAKYARMEASWRQLPLSSPSGQLLHRLEVVEQQQNYIPGEINYLAGGVAGFRMRMDEGNEHYDFPKGFTLGMIYDMIIQIARSDCRDWKLVFETGVQDPRAFGKFMMDFCTSEAESGESESNVLSYFEHKEHCALMLISTSNWWKHYEGPDRELWQPETLGEDEYVRRDFPRSNLH